MINIKYKIYQKGLTLLEIMIALTISMVLVAGILQIFVANKSSYRLNTALSGLQENARFALMLMERSIRGADDGRSLFKSSSCNKTEVIGSNNSALGSNLTTKSITVSTIFAGNSPIHITSATKNKIDVASSAKLIADKKLKKDDKLLLYHLVDSSFGKISNDCEIITIKALTEIAITINSNLSNEPYTNDIVLNEINGDSIKKSIYMIKLSESDQSDYSILFLDKETRDECETQAWGTNCTSNLMLNDGSAIYPLVEGVEGIQVMYGILSTNGDKFSYLTAGDITDWDNVNSIKISILMASLEEVTTKPIKYNFDKNNDGIAEEITATDRRIRKVFNTTIALRSRLE